MSTTAAALIVAVVVAVSVAGTYWLLHRQMGRNRDARGRFVDVVDAQAEAARRLDPVALGADADLPLDVAAHLFDFGLANPDVADGFARLDQADRDHRTNSAEGEA